jgi:leucyl aminopeptidase
MGPIDPGRFQVAITTASYDRLARFDTVALGLTQGQKGWPAGLPAALRASLDRLRALGDATGKVGEVHVLYPEGRGPRRVLVCGLGPAGKLTLREVRNAAGRAAKRAQALKAGSLGLVVESFAGARLAVPATAEALALSAALAVYQYREFKREDPPAKVGLALVGRRPADCAPAARAAEAVAEAANYARTLANRPANRLFPQALAQEARRLARGLPGVTVRVLSAPQLKAGRFGALLAVGSGSVHPPALIEIAYRGGRAGSAPVALVGKGITFDSGGISLKPSARMEDMKFDMSGAAAVLGVVRAAARLRLKVNLVGVVPAAENLPSGSAYRPGDILTTLSGLTVEVLNTDAEGRLVLADALTYALRRKPAAIVDLATLTGAASVALGPFAVALLSNADKLAGELTAAGERSGERTWRLPLWEEYRDLLKSEVADLANVASKPVAGTIVGGIFLQRFVGDTPWVHLDIAAGAYTDAPGPVYAKGATGIGVRLVVEWLKSRK